MMGRPPRIHVPGGRPKHQKQLQTGSPTASQDCGPITELVGLEAASGNEIRPRLGRRKQWVAAIREPMHHGPTWPSTTLLNISASVESKVIAGRFRARDLKPPNARVRKISHDDAVALLRQGRYLHVAIDYGRLNDLMPHLSGSPTYRGGHAIGLYGLDQDEDGWPWTLLYDPLHDGRRHGIPRGIQTVRVRRYLRAAETWGTPQAGRGNAYVVVIREG
jgi:hypothetical protein